MVEIIPAILPRNFQELRNTLEKLHTEVTTVQIDVVDGHFAPNTTWPYASGKAEFQKILSQEEGMPFWEDFDFEFDLMVKDAAKEVPNFIQAGAARIVVHAGSDNAREALEAQQDLRGEGKGFISLGVALSSGGEESFEPFAGLCDFVQVMGIEKVGFQGRPFDTRALSLISQLRAANPALEISVDGGVRMENIAALVEAGANHLIVGSLILSQPDVKVAIREILEIANQNPGTR